MRGLLAQPVAARSAPLTNAHHRPRGFGLPFTEVHFGVDASGQPQLDGWWIPAEPDNARTVLMLHSATGNMADALGAASTLHQLHLNVLLFDYRGYGHSGGDHPAEALMQADAHSALDYLLKTRLLPASSLIVYGRDLGAPLALQLCAISGNECPAMILDAPDGDLQQRVASDIRSRAVPSWLLFHQRFPLDVPLSTYPDPKLLIRYDNNQPSQMLRNAADPKMLLAVRAGDESSLRSGIQRFLEDNNPQN